MKRFAALFFGLALLLCFSLPAWGQESPLSGAQYTISAEELTRLDEIFKALNEKLQKATSELETSKTAYAELLRNRETLRTEYKKSLAELEALRQEWDALKAESEALKGESEKWRAASQELAEKSNALTALLENSEKDSAALRRAWEELTTSFERAKESWTRYDAEMSAKIKRLTTQRNVLLGVSILELLLLFLF